MENIIKNAIPFERITEHLRAGLLQAVTASATHIATGNTVVFISRSSHGVPRWSRDPKVVPRKVEQLRIQHALASAAIPLVFPSVRIDGEFYCDGGLRQNVPLSPARHLGANGMIVVSPRFVGEIQKIPDRPNPRAKMPSPMFLVGKALNALLLDRVENDIERLQRINSILLAGQSQFGDAFLPKLNAAMGYQNKHEGMKPLSSLLVRASDNIGKMAVDYVCSPTFAKRTPGALGRIVKKICESDEEDESDLLSYLLFDGEFAMQLIELGRRDAKAVHKDLLRFFTELPGDLSPPIYPPAPENKH
jgi:NTE family protein